MFGVVNMSNRKNLFVFLSFAIFLFGSAQTPAPTLVPISLGWYEETTPYFEWGGSWSNSNNAQASNGAFYYSADAGATLSFNFYGTGIALYGVRSTNRGERQICIDSDCDTTDWYDVDTSYFEGVVYDGLDYGLHTFVMSKVSGTYLDADAVHVWGGPLSVIVPTSQAIEAGTLDTGEYYEVSRSATFGDMATGIMLALVCVLLLVLVLLKVIYGKPVNRNN